MAWAENPIFRYRDLHIDIEFRQNISGRYQAAGFLFRYSDEGSYYSALVSTKGYFRCDTVFNGTPITLVPWTEIAKSNKPGLNRLRIIVSGERFVFVVNDAWTAEVTDGTLSMGKTAFALADYQNESGATARLERCRIESRPAEVEAAYYRWNKYIPVDPSARIKLAASFHALGQALPALSQIKKAWKELEASKQERSQASFIMAAECALALSLLTEAEEYLDRCVEADNESAQAERALCLKARMLYDAGRFIELRDHTKEAASWFPNNVELLTLSGHALVNLGQAREAAKAYREAASLSPDDAYAAQNLASAEEELGNADAAVEAYIRAGNAFLKAESYEALNLVLQKGRGLKADEPRFLALEGKLAFALEHYDEADKLLRGADKDDAAVPFLRGLIRQKKGHWSAALPFFDRAVAMNNEYAPFLFRAAETRFLLSGSASKRCHEELEAALLLSPDDPWALNLAAQIAIAEGDLSVASRRAAAAYRLAPNEMAVKANLAELKFLEGKADEALKLLGWAETHKINAQKTGQGGGLLENEAGNILVRLGRFEEAELAYATALKADPSRPDYLNNRASVLLELGRYGEADVCLAKAFELEPTPRTTELIAYVALKKGEFARAEAAYQHGLTKAPDELALLKGLSWLYLLMSRWDNALEIIERSERLVQNNNAKDDEIAELRHKLEEATTRIVRCAECGRQWRVEKDPAPIGRLRLIGELPDELPAGTCPSCGNSFCVACGRKAVKNERLHCPKCGGPLKLSDEGIKKLLAQWSASQNAAAPEGSTSGAAAKNR